ncbi:hypothetical protein D9M73_173690 [compost metagenome]
MLQNPALDSGIGKADFHVHQEPVKLGFRQRIGTFLLDGVLRSHHQKQRRQLIGAAPDTDLPLAHGFEQGRLNLGRGAVDFVRQYQVVEDRALLEHEAAGFRAVDFRTGNVGRQQVRGELDAVELRFDAFGKFFDGLGLGQARSTLDQHMAVGEQGDEQSLDEFFLAENLR